jgi:hypothetical protein
LKTHVSVNETERGSVDVGRTLDTIFGWLAVTPRMFKCSAPGASRGVRTRTVESEETFSKPGI